MSAAVRTHSTGDYFADLQEDMVNVIAIFAMVVSYLWLAGNTWVAYLARGFTDRAPSSLSWAGSALLMACALAGFTLRHSHLRVASYLLAWGALAATLLGVPALALTPDALPYFLILPVLLGSVLLGQRSFVALALVAFVVAAALEPGLLGVGGESVQREELLAFTLLVLVALASWLSTRRLYLALQWVWSGYERANRNEELARDRQGELERTLKALDEATYRLERANYMLTLARDQAEEARRLKQQFAQTISHELRTPLNIVVGFAELMTQSPEYYGARLAPAYLRDLSAIYRNALHLQTLVNDVLDLARLEAAQLALAPEEVDPAALVQDAVNTARSLVEAQGLELQVEIQPDLPCLALDPTRIRQVLFNLLNNAVRFTERGRVAVRVERMGDELIFSVADSGVGIPPEHIERIFEEFHQVDGGTRRRHGGIGLGLTISRRFVTLHGGRMWVESAVGQGSTFYFSLPLRSGGEGASPALPAPERPAEPAATTESGKPLLLAVTASLAAATMLTRHIQGCHTVIAPDLAQAHQAARQLVPQAVIVDRAITDAAPVELAALGQDWGVPRAAFMVCPLPADASHVRPLAANGYLVKPVSRESLWDVLRQFGERIERVLVIDDDEEFVQLLARMLDNPVRRYRVMTAYSGREGLLIMQRRKPDLVLLDLKLPDIPGSEVIRQIHAHPAWRSIPVVVVSARDEPEAATDTAGPITIARAAPFSSAEIARWVQNLVEMI